MCAYNAQKALQQPRITASEKLSRDLDEELTDRDVSSERPNSEVGKQQQHQHHHYYGGGLSESLKKVGLVGMSNGQGIGSTFSLDNTSSPTTSTNSSSDQSSSNNHSVAKFLQEQRLKESMRSQLKAEVTAEVQREVQDRESWIFLNICSDL
jgi:hypothetical protein